MSKKESILNDKKRASMFVSTYSEKMSIAFETACNEVFEDAFDKKVLADDIEQQEAMLLLLVTQIAFQKQILEQSASELGIDNIEKKLEWLTNLVEADYSYEEPNAHK